MKREYFNTDWHVQPVTGVFNFATSESVPVTLPHDAMIGMERNADAPTKGKSGYFPSGSCEYVKTLFVPKEYQSKRVTLEFEGSYSNTTVYVNGQFAGQCPYGYSNFYVSLDPYLHYDADNEIKAIVRNNDDSRWYSGLGLYRNVRILVGEPVHVALDSLQVSALSVEGIHSSAADLAKLQVAVGIANESMNSQPVRIRMEILSPDGTIAATEEFPVSTFSKEVIHTNRALYIKHPQLWGLDTPVLYTCRVTVFAVDSSDASLPHNVLDIEETTFGIRTLQLDPFHGLRLNGETIKLRGTCIHHDNGVIGAATIERAEERRVEIMKKAGFNAIRTSHNPCSKALLCACDRIGMLIMDECFDMWTEQKSIYDYSIHFPQWWERDVEHLVKKDFNHPSVIMYSIGNEIPDIRNAGGNRWGRKIANKIKELDSTRFTINSINGMLAIMDEVVSGIQAARKQAEEKEDGGELNTMLAGEGNPFASLSSLPALGVALEEPCGAVDIAGYNYMTGRHVSDHEAHPNRIICGSETYSRDLAQNWKLIEENPFIIGDFCWTGWDYLGEAGIGKVTYGENTGLYSPYPWYIADCGDIDILGNRRPVSYYKEIVWGLRKDPYIAVLRPEHYGEKPNMSPWSWSDCISSWSFDNFVDKPVQLEIYASGEEVELILNGKSQGKKPVGEKLAFRADFEITYEPGELIAVSYEKGVETGRMALYSATGDVQMKVTADRMEIMADTTDLAFINITLQDANGNLYSDKDRSVTVEVTGSGHLQGLGSRKPDSEEPVNGNCHRTYDGKALAVIRPDGVGTITVKVKAEGLPMQSIEITTK